MKLMNTVKKSIKKHWQLYLLLIPVIAYYIVFKYKPMVGVQIAFRDFRLRKGMWNSNWVGMKHFIRFFSSYNCLPIIGNTLYLGFLSLVFCFPFPVFLALVFKGNSCLIK